MRRIAVCSFALAQLAMGQALASCVAISDGDVSLQGPVGERLESMFRNHVLAEDPVYLTACYGERTETELWQTEFWGKYMHSAAPFWTMTGDALLKAKLDAGVENLLKAQLDDGYLGNYAPERRAGTGTWDVWGCKYTMLGLLHYHDAMKDANPALAKRAIAACGRLCDWLIKTVGPGAKTTIAETGNYAGQPSCSCLEPVMWLYNRTHEARYLEFAAFIVKEMTENPNGPRLLDLSVACVPVSERSEIPSGSIWRGVPTNRGKAYEMMSCYQGLIEYAEATGRKDLVDAAVATAWDIADQEINLAGSGASCEHWYHGAKHQHEAFPHTQETCVTITWLRLCEKLLTLTGEPRWADQMERTFYNAYLGSLSPDGRRFASYTPLNGARSEGQLHCRMHTNCCNANGPRGFLSFMRTILTAKDDEVFVNHYVSSRASVEVSALKEKVLFEMHTLYPKTGSVDIRYRGAKPATFRLSLRVPRWAMAGADVKVNGKGIRFERKQSGAYVTRYVTVAREWRPGDAVSLELPLTVEAHRLGDSVAFTRGPVLLSRDDRFGDGELSEVLRNGDFDEMAEGFRLERTPCGDEMAMTVAAQLPVGANDQNIDQRQPATIRFCDYASAGNRWRADNAYRSWLPVEKRLLSAFPEKRRLDRSKFIVGSYAFGGVRNPKEEDVKRLADCGIDVIKYGNAKTNVLDWFSKYGVLAFRGWVMPGDWWWFNSDPKKKFKNGERWCGWDVDRLKAYFGMTADHPAVAGVDVWDEPNGLDYPFLGKITRTVLDRYPEQYPFFNLFPNYALPDSAGRERALSQLGTKDYETYIAEYCKHIPLDYICYDFYPFAWKVTPRQFYDNLRVVADACTATGKSHWLYLQATRYNGNKKADHPILNEPRLRYQAAASLAYGAECIIWACWAPAWGGWDINVVDADGNPTVVYEPLKKVNKALHRLSPEYMRYRRMTTDLVGFEGELAESSGTAFRHVKATDGAALAVGHFAARSGNGDYALFVAAIDDPNGANAVEHSVTFALPRKGYRVRAVDGNGDVKVTVSADGTMSVPLQTCHGVFVIAERSLADM